MIGNMTKFNMTNKREEPNPLRHFVTANAIISCVIVVVTLSIILVIWSERQKILNSPSNRLLFSLCISDCLGGIAMNLQVR